MSGADQVDATQAAHRALRSIANRDARELAWRTIGLTLGFLPMCGRLPPPSCDRYMIGIEDVMALVGPCYQAQGHSGQCESQSRHTGQVFRWHGAP